MYNNSAFNYVENTNKKLLYVIVAIAALLVATLSGTFAYFTASATATNAITGTIADVGITLGVEKLSSSTKTAANGTTLVPFNLINTGGTLVSSLLTTSGTGAFPMGCIDENDYTACDIYRITIKANNSININGYLKIGPATSNTEEDNIPNVKWMLLGPKSSTSATAIEGISNSIYNTSYMSATKSIASLSYTNYSNSSYLGHEFTGGGVTTDATSTTANGVTIYKNNSYDVIGTSNSYYYIIVWLEDTEDAQDDRGNYKGTVTFRAEGTAEGQITAKFG